MKQRAFFNTLEDTLGSGIGWSDSPTSNEKERKNVNETRVLARQTRFQDILPSSMFLIRTLRSTTSLSALNCSLSDVTRRTIFLNVVSRKRKPLMGWVAE